MSINKINNFEIRQQLEQVIVREHAKTQKTSWDRNLGKLVTKSYEYSRISDFYYRRLV